MAIGTNKPIGSTDPRDLLANAENIDNFANGQAAWYPDRFGIPRKSIKGIEVQASELIGGIESDAAVRITQAIINAGYQYLGDYASGITVSEYNQLVRYDNEFWKPASSTSLPFTTTNWGADSSKFVGVGDAVLREDISLLSGIKDLKPIVGVVQNVKGFYQGSTIGGGQFYYDPSKSKIEHNGGTIIAPEALFLWEGTHSDLETLFNWTGLGDGCFIRNNAAYHANEFGAVPDFDMNNNTGTDNTASFKALFKSTDFPSCSGDYKYLVLDEIAPSKKFILNAAGATVCQRTKTKPLINFNGCSGSEIHYGDFTNNADISEYELLNARLLYANQHLTDITLYNVKVLKTFQQGLDIDLSGDNISVLACHFEETARDAVFLLNCTNSKVGLSTFINTGDDAIVFAGQSYNAIASSNTIKGAGSYNIGGSGIRFNRSGVAIGNTIENSDLFGIIAADNSVDAMARPDNLKLIGNTITGINKTGTVTAGIGFKNVLSVECIDNDIIMPNQEAHAYRLYGTTKSGNIGISGGSVSGARSVLYVREAGADKIAVSKVKAKATDANSHSEGLSYPCDRFVFIEGTGNIDDLVLSKNESINVAKAGYLEFGTNSLTVGRLHTFENRLKNPTGIPFVFNNANVTTFESNNDEWATNVFADFSGHSNVDSIVIDGRYNEKLSANGIVTFNATNSGLISFGTAPLSRIPLKSDINLTLESTLGSASHYYVDFADRFSFRIFLNSPPDADVTFNWSVNTFNKRKIK
jgi:hypothetical protein